MAITTTSVHARLMRMTLRKHGAWLACCAVLLAIVLAVNASYWWQLTDGGATPATSGTLEGSLAVMLFLAALVWPCLGFGTLICHGVSRRTIVREQTVTNLAVACAAAVVLFAGWLVTTSLGTPLTLSLAASRFRYAYSTVMAHDGGIFRADVGVLPPSVAAAAPEAGQPLAMGDCYVFLGTVATMVVVAMAGQLIGTVLMVVWSHGHRLMAAIGAAVMLVAGLELGGMRWQPQPGDDSMVGWLVDAAKGGVWTSLDGMRAVRTVVWLPLAYAAMITVVAVWATHRLTDRCEVPPDRGGMC